MARSIVESVLPRAAKNISAADDERHFDAQIVDFFYFAGDVLDCFGVNAEILRAGKRFAGKFQHDSLVNGCPRDFGAVRALSRRLHYHFGCHLPAGILAENGVL